MAKTSVTVGIPVLNEGKTIKNLLETVLVQKEENFFLKEIIVYSDGSTDNTVSEVKKVKDSRIKLIVGKKRKGKAVGYEKIFAAARGKIIVTLDGDILIRSRKVIAQLIKPILEEENVGLVSGNSLPVIGKTFVEKAVNASFTVYEHFRSLRDGDNVFACNGPILAFIRSFARQVTFPKGIVADDHYLYFYAKSLGYGFRYAREAKVWYQSPSTLEDQVRQSKRFLSGEQQMREIFGEEAKREYQVPLTLRIKAKLIQAYHQPLESLGIFFINSYCRLLLKSGQNEPRALWTISQTTKGGFQSAKANS